VSDPLARLAVRCVSTPRGPYDFSAFPRVRDAVATWETAAILSRLKRVLRPFRPVLLPIWNGLLPLVEVTPTAHGRGAWKQALGRRLRPIRPLRKGEFDALAREVPYYKSRWPYMSVAGAVAGELIAKHRLRSALELGPHIRPLVVGADVLDLQAKPDLQAEARVIVHDATNTPWPIGPRRYGLFIGLQVFEHLGDRQNDAFLEVCRIARHAIISVPIDWQMDNPDDCHHQISNERALTWFKPIAPTRVVLGNPGAKKRLVYVFENLDKQPSAQRAAVAGAIRSLS
jgi:hypothetical protein